MVKTLIVDDSEVFRRSVRELLASRFAYMSINEAATLREAAAMVRASRPDLVFADIRLPDGNGLDFARGVAATLPRVRLCVVTSFDLPEYRSAAAQSGARHYIHKGSATQADFGAVIDALLRHRFTTLLVDDDESRRGSCARSLVRRWPAMLVFEAADVRSAVAIAEAVRPWLVLVRASHIDGERAPLCRAIKSLDARTTLVATGELAADAERVRVMRDGADFAAAWPEHGDAEITPIVKGLLSRHRAQRLPA
jgi:DNA-binding NarL/FixJ family response regulator